MNLAFYGVRGSIPAPGPATVRYGGNTACVAVKPEGGGLIILDCGTGARNLGIGLMEGPFGQGRGEASILLSHAHWDHIQGFPFFVPLYQPGNRFHIFGGAKSSSMLEGILEGQMAPQYFPVQTLKNMGASIDIVALAPGTPRDILGCRVTAAANPHGRAGAMAFRIEEGDRSVVYASDAGYGEGGPSAEALALYRGADLLIHDSTYTPEDRARYPHRGLASVDEAVAAALAAGARRLALFHYDQDYTDADVDRLIARARHQLAKAQSPLELHAAAEGATITV